MKTLSVLFTCVVALAGGLASAQPAAMAKGPPGAGQGQGRGQGRMYGWSLMTPQERTEHQQKMQSFDDYATCTAYVAEHHALLQARAKEKGVALPPAPRRDRCEHLKH
ncbi:MAG TPA: hypothetical protein VFS55_01965 [Dokdonella sp.]|nr:hypothetical protein [Dokdonella sp.]